MYRRFAKILGKNLRRRRGAASLRDFASRVGVSKSELHRMEQGEQNVSISTVELLCHRLKCGIAELFDQNEQ